ncbi:uncharacterized protein LOC141620140 [Silene latifolia]|uniref:uncharacterized protein LOC141620140 n=1 Tax=Silene latifolia TaxID=37657 RepID=UPI003D77F45B
MDTGGNTKNRPFKYFNIWSSAPGFQDCIKNRWRQRIERSKMFKIVTKLKALKQNLKNLNTIYFSDVENNADLAQTQLINVQQLLVSSPGNEELMRQEYDLLQTSKLLNQAKWDFLKQKAKAHWIQEGDCNSAYFHGVIKARRNKKSIHQIRDHKNNLYTDETGI